MIIINILFLLPPNYGILGVFFLLFLASLSKVYLFNVFKESNFGFDDLLFVSYFIIALMYYLLCFTFFEFILLLFS